MKTAERDRARSLRRDDGRSIKEIARLLRVSPSSVSLWVRDIELSEEKHEALRERNPAYNRQRRGNATMAVRARAKRRAYQEEGRNLARRNEPLHAAGCMLFSAEGSRRQNTVCFSNSDPQMVRFFVAFSARTLM